MIEEMLKQFAATQAAQNAPRKTKYQSLLDVTEQLFILFKTTHLELDSVLLQNAKTVSDLNSQIEKLKTEKAKLEKDIDNLTSVKKLELVDIEKNEVIDV